ncbi:hypothetical protein CspeluHIS016_0901140 [Cutaneotrichosporon spelunceum]|uniref:histone acetyltransferase n=1 Tax=Cutaneotrichosporon spelunceum TaxID=1672016 RepID=A0AAD3TZY2_9TREE|nr:hypothetical protein CspeluHIS016_0901140 [Cutaneotrichosporon spelunceum]
MSSSLRDALVAHLTALPNAAELGVTVLVSAPKRTTAIFPHAPSASVRCWETEYLVVVNSSVPEAVDPGTNGSHPEPAQGPQAIPQSNTTTSQSSTTTRANPQPTAAPTTPRVLAAAISAHLYTLPSPSPTSILYISKVDSSGYAPPSPLTRVLASGLLSYFLSPSTRPGGVTGSVTATLFARSQGQYLFPNSVEGGGKRVLGGLGLCQWWKSVYEDAARLVGEVELSYLLPSYSASEAKGILGPSRQPGVKWIYAPPFRTRLFRAKTSLATLIPSLPDDPKTRFLEELVSSALDIPSTQQSQDKEEKEKRSRKDAEAAEDEAERRRAHVALAKVPAGEFWERMGFRQECASGDVTGFFSAHAGPQRDETERSPSVDGEREGERPYEPPRVPHAVSKPLVERILTSMLNTDFGTRSLAYAGTDMWLASTRALVLDEVGEDGWAASSATIAPTSSAAAPAPKRKEEAVTMLQPRKKKRV